MYRPILDAEDLPRSTASEVASETQYYDFKATVVFDGKKAPEDVRNNMAVDVASFANALGGTLLVGGVEAASGPEYPGIERDRAELLRLEYEQVAQGRCVPPAHISARILRVAERYVLAVNVDAASGGLIGVRHKQEEGFRFPLRVGREPELIFPDRFPMIFDARHRRVLLMLQNLQRQRAPVKLLTTGLIGSRAEFFINAVYVEDIEEASNCVTLRTRRDGSGTGWRLPLDAVTTIWRDFEVWYIELAPRFLAF